MTLAALANTKTFKHCFVFHANKKVRMNTPTLYETKVIKQKSSRKTCQLQMRQSGEKRVLLLSHNRIQFLP